MKFPVLALAVATAGWLAPAQAEVLRGHGHPMNTQLIGSVRLNPASELVRQWVVVNDADMPVQVSPDGFMGVWPVYSERNRGFIYRTEFALELSAPVVAVQVNHVVFDVWQRRVATLTQTDISNLGAGGHTFRGEWRILRESDAESHYMSLTYVNRVRLADGTIINADLERILIEAERISTAISLADLTPSE